MAKAIQQIRDLLDLDLKYYSSSDPNLLDDVVHKLKVGGKQILKRPTLLLNVVRKFDLSALFVPDRKRILLDVNMKDLKKRWCESHEIAHSLLPWHKEYLLADTISTLSPGCHDAIEAEANYAAGRLIFPNMRFTHLTLSASPSISHIRLIASTFGNTITSALWRYVELSKIPCAAIIGDHPHHSDRNDEIVTHFVESVPFSQQFNNVTPEDMIAHLRGYCSFKTRGSLGTNEIELENINGDLHVFHSESFSNSYQVLTLVHWVRSKAILVAA